MSGTQASLGLLLLSAGAVMGSLVTTAAMRTAVGRPWIAGRSACEACDAPLGYLRTAPILSYLFQGGRCADCRAPIPWAHPAGELAGLAIAAIALTTGAIQTGLLCIGVGFCALYAAVFDGLTMTIPNLASAAILGLGGIWAYQADRLLGGAIAAISVFVILTGLKFAFSRLRGREGVGGGDVKLLAALAMGVGWEGLPVMMVVSSAAALAWIAAARALRRPVAQRLAFAPFIALGWLAAVAAAPMTAAWVA